MNAYFSLDVDVDKLDSAQFKFTQVAGNVDSLGLSISDIPSHISAAQWSGKARDMACAELSAIGAQVKAYHRYFARMSIAMKMIAHAVRDAEKNVKLLNRQWDIMVENRAAAGRKTPVTGASSVNAVESDFNAMAPFRAEEARLEKAFQEVKDTVRQRFKDLAGKFEYEVELPISVEQRANLVAAGVTLAGVGSGVGAAADLQNQAEAELSAVMPLVRVRIAREDAAAAETALDRAMQTKDPAALQEFNDIAARHPTDQAFQIELIKAVGVKKLTGFGLYLQESGSAFQPPQHAVDLRTPTVTYLGVALVQAGSPSYDGDLPAFYAENIRTWRKDEYFPALKEVGRAQYVAESPVPMRDWPRGTLYGYQIIGQYMYAGGKAGAKAGSSMSTEVGLDMIRWDKEHVDAAGDWSAQNPVDWYANRSLVGPETPASVDPITGVLATIGKDKPTSQELLLTNIGTADKVETVQRYLMDPRRTEHMDTNADPNYGQDLGEAIYTADADSTDMRSTQVAHEALNTYAEFVGKKGAKKINWASFAEKNGYERTSEESTYGDEHPGMRQSMARIMAHHIADFQNYGNRNSVPVEAGDKTASGNVKASWERQNADGTYSVSLTEDQFTTVLKDFAGDRPDDIAKLDSSRPNAVQIVIGAQLTYSAANMHNAVAAATGLAELSPLEQQLRIRDSLLAITENHQDSLTDMISKAGTGYLEIGKGKDDAEQFTKSLVEKGAGLIPIDLVTKTHPLAGAVGVGYEYASENLINTMFKMDAQEKAAKSVGDYADSSIKLHHQMAEQAFTNVTSWTGELSPEVWAQHPENHRRDNPGYSYEREKFWDANGKILSIAEMSSDQYSAFDDWKNDNNIGSGGEYTKFNNQMNRHHAVNDAKSDLPDK